MLLTKEDFKVGQEVACKHVGNKARYGAGVVTYGEVTRSGKKLVTVQLSNDNSIQFEFEESFERDYLLQKTNMSGNYELFPSKQDYLDYEEKQEKLSKIHNAVSVVCKVCKLNIDQVRRIYDIVNE